MQTSSVTTVSIIGAGLMGHGIAQVFISRGLRVNLYDVKDEILARAVLHIRSNLSMMASKGLGAQEDIEPAMSRIKTTTDMATAVAGTQFVIEAVPENLKLKRSIFRELDRLCPPETILATNTSVISISEIAAEALDRSRIIGTHFWNPPFLIPLVEVVKGTDTSDRTLDTTYRVLKDAGKHPVKVMKDVPGFIANRLQHALWREAISIVQDGIADAATVDEAVRNSFGIRLAVLGPLENADMVGLDMILSIHDYIFKHLDRSTSASPILRQKVANGDLGFKTGRGFQAWSAGDTERSRKRLIEYLIDAAKRQQA